MAISRILGASLVSDLDRQGVDLQFSTSGNSLVYMDFANFRLGINETAPQESLHVEGNLLVANGHVLTSGNLAYDLGSETNWWNNIYVNSIVAGSFTAGNVDGVLSTSSQPNITSLGTLTGLAIDGNLSVNLAIIPFTGNTSTIGTESLWWQSVYANIINAAGIYGTILTADQPNITNLGNIAVDSISIGGNITITGNTNGGVINADELYEANNRVLTTNTQFTISGDATGSGTYDDIEITLANTGVTAGVYGSADDEFADRIPKITVDSKGRITNIANVTLTQVGNVSFNDTTISSGSDLTLSTASNGNIYLDAQGTGIVYISGTDALGLPSGDSSNRPASPETGYFRYNTDIGSIEYWDGSDWISPGVQPISSQVLTPDGTVNQFILSDVATPESVLVMINGTLQQPYVAYNVSGNLITFSEVPLTSDVIEVRRIAAGATTVAGLALGPTTVSLTPGNVVVSGNLIPGANVTYDLGSDARQWRDLYLSGNTIYLGGAEITTDGSALVFTPAGGSPIDLSGDTDPASIAQGTSNVRVTENFVNVAVSGTNIAEFSASGLTLTGNVSATYIIGNGSQLTGLPAGYANANVAAYLPLYSGTLGGNLAVASLTGTLAVSQGGTGATTSADALNNLLPSGEQSGYVLKTSGAGTYFWGAESGGGGGTVGQELTTLRQSNTATSGQTVFDLVGGLDYTPGTGQLRVYINGVRQFPDAYTETSNVSYTLAAGVSAGTVVFAEIDAFSTFNNYANLTYASNIGNIQAAGLTVQNAIDSLETSKAPLSNPVFTGYVKIQNALEITQGGTGATTTADALNNLLPSGEQSGYVLKTSGPGSYYWSSESGGGGATVGQQLTTTRQANTATGGQSLFTLVDGRSYTPGTGQLRVYINGVRQYPSEYTETSNVSYTITGGVSAGDLVLAEIDQFSTFNNYANLTYASNVGNVSAAGLTVQSAIENLETNKAPLASPVFTGNPSINGLSIGFKELPQLTTSNVTLALTDSGKHFYVSSAGTYWYQVPSNANVAFPVGTTVVIVNRTTGNITANTQAEVSMYLAGNATTGNRTITAYGMATLIKTGTNEWFINGTGVV